jgi:alpha-beta hydrolase superfamily lysophospholipase
MIDTWFGREGAETLGFVHVPPAGARAGVVICPPLGYEQFNAYRAMRFLGQDLADRGLAAVRFDYAGEGDAVGEPGRPDAVERWLGTVADAVALLRGAGVQRVALVGMSSGALIAAEAARRSGTDGLVLWDPSFSGRRFLRRQRTLSDLVVAPEAAGANPVLSTVLHPEAAAWIDGQRVDAEALAGITAPMLVLARTSAAQVPDLGAGAEVRRVDGQEQLLDVSSSVAAIPEGTVKAITGWLSDRLRGEPQRLHLTPLTEIEVGRADDGEPIVERLSRRGPEQLFTIETTRAHSPALRGAVLLQPAAAEHRASAGRFQVRIARELAGRGFRALRFDRRITGDSTIVVPGEQNLVLTEEWVKDADALVAELREPQLALVGICAGAWVSARVAATRPNRLAVLVGPNYWRTQPMQPDAYARLVLDTGGVEPRIAGLKSAVRDRIPNWLWRLVAPSQLFNNPATLLRAPAARGGAIALLMPPEDAVTFERNRGADAVARLRSRGADIRVAAYDEGDHAMLGEALQARALADIVWLLDETMPDPARVPAVPVGSGT